MERAPTRRPLTPIQKVVATLLGLGYSYEAIGGFLHIRASTVKVHVKRTAAKIPGDLPAAMRIAVWARGAPIAVLTGLPLREALGLPDPHPTRAPARADVIETFIAARSGRLRRGAVRSERASDFNFR